MRASKFETFYVQSMASECDSGYIFLPEDQYVDPIILNEINRANAFFPLQYHWQNGGVDNQPQPSAEE